MSDDIDDKNLSETEDRDKENDERNLKPSGGGNDESRPEDKQFPELDDETLQKLRDDESSEKKKKFEFHPKLAASWEKVLSPGLSKEKKKLLLETYPRVGNC